MKAEETSKSASNKPKTKYDRKMEARRLQEEKDKRNAKIARITGIVIVVVLAAVVVYLAASSVIRRNHVMNDTYVMINDEAVTEHEFDFYYNTYVNSFLSTYSSILPYMGLDTSKSYASQSYDDTKSWKDVFDEAAVNSMISTKSMYAAAVSNNFDYDVTEDYNTFVETLKSNAKESGVSAANYYKAMYGTYATEANVKAYVEESLMAEAYYNKILEDNTPSDDEITAYYEENKKNYDLSTFYSFSLSPVTDSESGTEILSEDAAKANIYEMADRLEKGEDFESLCIEYAATDTVKANYENADSEYSLSEKQNYSSINSLYRDWIYDEARKEGDVEVVEDADNATYYVVKFVSVEYDDTCRDTISNSLASQAAQEYASSVAEGYEVTDVKGELNYLTMSEEASEAESLDGTQNENASDSVESVSEEAAETQSN